MLFQNIMTYFPYFFKKFFFSFYTMKINGDLLYVVLDPMDENSHTVLERYEK